jgi:hypothetical protein
MTFKEQSLLTLMSLGLNIHNYSVLSTYEELLEYQRANPNFSIRFDSDTPSSGLPFYTYDSGKYKDSRNSYETGEPIVRLAHSMNCKLLCADGRKYDKIQLCNYVYRLDAWYDYVLEVSFVNQPLRRMYDGSTVILKGNLYSDEFYLSGTRHQRRYLSRSLLNNMLTDMHVNSMFGKWCECTLYPCKVGKLNTPVVYWQVI